MKHFIILYLLSSYYVELLNNTMRDYLSKNKHTKCALDPIEPLVECYSILDE